MGGEDTRRLAITAGRTLLIAEVAQAHDGSLGMAHAYIDAVGAAGADGVKFQTHIAAAESTLAEPWRVRFSLQDESRYAYWRRMEFTEEQWRGLRRHAESRGLLFLSSPFSAEAVALLKRVGTAAWKIASGEVQNPRLLDAMAEWRVPVLLSTGMSDFAETDAAVAALRERGLEVVVLQCTSAYPCPPERVGLNVIEEFRRRYGGACGISDHSGTIYPGLAAAAMGAEIVEVHVTMSREMFGPDVSASVTTGELADLARGIRFLEAARAHPVDKDAAARDLGEVRRLFTKSVVAGADLPIGTILREADLAVKKPGTGIPARELSTLIGGITVRPLKADELIRPEDVVRAS